MGSKSLSRVTSTWSPSSAIPAIMTSTPGFARPILEFGPHVRRPARGGVIKRKDREHPHERAEGRGLGSRLPAKDAGEDFVQHGSAKEECYPGRFVVPRLSQGRTF